METEVRKLRATLAQRKGGRGRRFAPELRRQISTVGRGPRDKARAGSGLDARSGCPGRRCRGFARRRRASSPSRSWTPPSRATSSS